MYHFMIFQVGNLFVPFITLNPSHMKKSIVFSSLFISVFILIGQEPYAPESLSSEDYTQAENALWYRTMDLTYNLRISPIWKSDHEFAYERQSRTGTKYLLVNARQGEKSELFDHAKLAKALTTISDQEQDADHLTLRNISLDDEEMTFRVGRERLSWNFAKEKLEILADEALKPVPNSSISPDKSKAVYIKDHNLWLQDLKTGEEVQLTQDGIEDFGYGTNNAGWIKSDRPVLLWSPDSKKIATFQHDGRGVGEMYMVTTNVGHPELEAWKYPLPGDSLIFRIHRVVIDLEKMSMVRLDMPPDMHRSSVTDHIALRGGKFADVEWSDDSESLAFVSSSRDHQEATLRMANIQNGEVRELLYEKVATFFESGYRTSNWRYLPESNEFIWYSQKSNWGHLYLYDLTTGKLKNQITSGDWNVTQVLKLDTDQREIYFYGCGREPGDPYYQYLYKATLDGQELILLTPENSNHTVSFSPKGDYFVDQFSTPQSSPQSILRDNQGKKITLLEKADITKLLASGWSPPENITVKARDGETDLYGLLFKPKNFDPNKKYPIINYIYPGPQSGSVGSRNFSASRRDNQAIADLGFIVVSIDAMGTPLRSKSFHEAYYGNMGDNGLPDQITGMKQLAEKYAWIDLERAGIYGHSGGGFASTDAILRYPDFFKVAVSGAGNHDNRNYEDDWGEKWQGLLVQNEDGTTNYDNQANQLIVENLKGKLLLTHGTLDGNVPVYNTLLVADRLIAANKDFDMILFPNRGHGFANEPYMMRKRWDYFVKNLLGAEPPKEFAFRRPVRP